MGHYSITQRNKRAIAQGMKGEIGKIKNKVINSTWGNQRKLHSDI